MYIRLDSIPANRRTVNYPMYSKVIYFAIHPRIQEAQLSQRGCAMLRVVENLCTLLCACTNDNLYEDGNT